MEEKIFLLRRAISTRLIMLCCLLSVSLVSSAQVTISYDNSYSSLFPFTVYECGGGPIYLVVNNNGATALTFPMVINFNFTGGNPASGGVPNATVSNPIVTLPSGTATSSTPSPTSTGFAFTITSSSSLAVGAQMEFSFDLLPNCGLMGINGQFIGGPGNSQYPITLYPTYTLYENSTSGTQLASYTYDPTLNPNEIKVDFPYLLMGTPNPTTYIAGITMNIADFNFGSSFSNTLPVGNTGENLPSFCESQTYTSMPSGAALVSRIITVTNAGSSMDLRQANQTIQLTDIRSVAGLNASAIFTSTGAALTSGVSITHVTTGPEAGLEDFITLNYAAIQTALGSTTFASSASFTLIESYIVTGSLCNVECQSNISCAWNCPGTIPISYCYESELQCNTFIFPDNNPAMFANPATKTNVGYCYDAPVQETYNMSFVNNGTAPATTNEFVFSTIGGLNGWTDYDFSTDPTGLTVTLGTSVLTAGTDYSFTVTPTSTAPVVKTITLTLNGVAINPGVTLYLSWGATTTIPTGADYVCAANSMDQWQVLYTYYGSCNGHVGYATNQDPTFNVFESQTIDPGTTLYSGPNNLIGNNQPVSVSNPTGPNYYPDPNPPGVVSFRLPQFGAGWPAISPASDQSMIIRISLDDDLNIWHAWGAPQTNEDHSTAPSTGYTTTNLGQMITFTALTSGGMHIPVTPACIYYVGGGPSDAQPDVIEARFDLGAYPLDYLYNLSHMTVTMNIEPHCPEIVGNNHVNIEYFQVPDNTCDGPLSCATDLTNRIPLGCDDNIIIVQCPGCEIVGLYQNFFDVSRTSFGLQDANDDGLADGAGNIPVTFSDAVSGNSVNQPFSINAGSPFIANQQLMYNDIFETRTVGNIMIGGYNPVNGVNGFNLNTDVHDGVTNSGFKYAFTRINFGSYINDMAMAQYPTSTPQQVIKVYWNEANQVYGNQAAGTWYGPIYMTVAQAEGFQSLATSEYCYDISTDRLAQAAAGTGIPTPGIFMDGMKIVVDCNFQFTGSLPPGPPVQAQVYTTTYLGLRDETDGNGNWPPSNISATGGWLVNMQGDPSFGIPTYLDYLCVDAPLNEATIQASNGGYPYQTSAPLNANAIVSSCNDVRWYCINGVGFLNLVGWNWTAGSHDNPSVFSCFAKLFSSDNASNLRTMTIGDVTSYDAFPYEYRNWVKEETEQVFGLPANVTLSNPYPWSTYFSFAETYDPNDYTDYPNAPYSLMNVTSTQLLVNTPIANYVDFTDYNWGADNASPTAPAEAYLPDDGFFQRDFIPITWPCGTNDFDIVVRQINTFPTNNLTLSPITNNRVLGSYPITVPTPTLNPNQRYYDESFHISIPKPTLTWIPANTQAIGVGGSITWTEPISNGTEYVLNPFVGFGDISGYSAGVLSLTSGWQINSVTYVDATGNPTTMVYNTSLNTYILPQPTSPDANPPISTYLTAGQNYVIINATYCCASLPTADPFMYFGILCDPLGLAATAASLGGFSAATTASHGCNVVDVPAANSVVSYLSGTLPSSLRDPIMAVLDQSSISTVNECGDIFTLDYQVTNTGYNNLNFDNGPLGAIQISIPANSGYAIASPYTATISYNGYSYQVNIQNPTSTSPYILYSEFSADLDAGLPGEQQHLTVPSSMTIQIPFTTVCGLSYAQQDLAVTIVGDNGCTATTTTCASTNLLSAPYYYNPLLYNTNSDYNEIGTAISLPSGDNNLYNQCAIQNITISFRDLLAANVGNPNVGDYNTLEISLPTGYTLVGATTSSGNIFPGFTSTGVGNWTYTLPSSPVTPVNSIPDVSLQVQLDMTATCSSTMSAVVATQRTYTCGAAACDLNVAQAPPATFALNITPPTPVISSAGTCDLSLSATGCDIMWSINGSAFSSSSPSISSAGTYTVTAQSTFGGCTTATVETYTVPANCNGCSGPVTGSFTINGNTDSLGTDTFCYGSMIVMTSNTTGAWIQYYIDSLTPSSSSALENTYPNRLDTLPWQVATPGTHTICMISYGYNPDSATVSQCSDTFCLSFTIINCCDSNISASITGLTDSVICIDKIYLLTAHGGQYGQFLVNGIMTPWGIWGSGGVFAVPDSGYTTALVADTFTPPGTYNICYIAYASNPDSAAPGYVICSDTFCETVTIQYCPCDTPTQSLSFTDSTGDTTTILCLGNNYNLNIGGNGVWGQMTLDGVPMNGLDSFPLVLLPPGGLPVNPDSPSNIGVHQLCLISHSTFPDGELPDCTDTFCITVTVQNCCTPPTAHISITDSVICLTDSTVTIIVSGSGPYFQLYIDSIVVDSNTSAILPFAAFPGGVITLPGPQGSSSLGNHTLYIVVYSDSTPYACTSVDSTKAVIVNCGCEATQGTSFIVANNTSGLEYSFYDAYTAQEPNFINWSVDGTPEGQTGGTGSFVYTFTTGIHIVAMQTATILAGENGNNICCYNTVYDTINIDACTYWKATDSISYQLNPNNIDSVTFTFYGSTSPLSPTIVWNFGDNSAQLVSTDLVVTHYYQPGDTANVHTVCADIIWSRGDSLPYDSTGICCCLDTICTSVSITPCNIAYAFNINVQELNSGDYLFDVVHNNSFTTVIVPFWTSMPDNKADTTLDFEDTIPYSATYTVCANFNYLVLYQDSTYSCPALNVCIDTFLAADMDSASINIYPNPATTTVTVQITNFSTTTSANVGVVDMTGQKVMSRSINDLGKGITQNVLDIRNLAPGVYFIKTTIGTVQQIDKLIKE